MVRETELKNIGVWQCGVVPSTELAFHAEVRRMCEANVCRSYGATWACPPAVGTLAQCREKCLQYGSAMLFNARYPLEDDFDYEGMMAGHRAFKQLCDRLYFLMKDHCVDCLILSNEGCIRCKSCAYPSGACRFPEMLFPSVEGYGSNVRELADRAGLSYNGGAHTVTYFGLLLSGAPGECPPLQK